MNVQKQIEEYRKKQAERFRMSAPKEEVEDDEDEEYKDAQIASEQFEEMERKQREQRDLEIAQKIERELNFRTDYQFEDGVGEEGKVANIPANNDRNYIDYVNTSNHQLLSSRNNRDNQNRYVKKDPPKWLTNPIKIEKDFTSDNENYKVYDFTNGSLNNELRKTNDTDVEYE